MNFDKGCHKQGIRHERNLIHCQQKFNLKPEIQSEITEIQSRNHMFVIAALLNDTYMGGGEDKLKNHDIPFIGMRKVHGNLQRLNK